MNNILEMRNFSFSYQGEKVKTLNNISLKVIENEALGIVGESGSGKTTLLLSLIGMLNKKGESSGEIYFEGKLLKEEKDFRILRWKDISMVFQNYLNVFNPKMTIKEYLYESLTKVNKIEKLSKVKELFDKVGLDEKFLESYPAELSGGMRQKVLIVSALICEPKIILVDEPTTALERISKIEVINILRTVNQSGVTLIITSHDLEVIKEVSQNIIVMENGNIVEMAKTKDFLEKQKHPYSRDLIQSSPFINIYKDLWGIDENKEINSCGCPYYFKCPQKIEKCKNENPELLKISDERAVACHLKGIIDILKINNLSKIYFNKKFQIKALNNVSLKIRMGEIVSLIGESGSGKTTLGEIIVGLKNKTEGEVSFLDKKIDFKIMSSLDSVQIIFQDTASSINLDLSIIDVLREPFLFLKEKVNFPATEAKILLKKLGFSDIENLLIKKVKNLSGGEIQRLGIVRALLMRPKLLVADEITSMLDPSRKANLVRLLKGLQNEYGFSMLFITHDLLLAKKITDYFYIMKEGEIIEFGDTNKIFNFPKHDYTKKLLAGV